MQLTGPDVFRCSGEEHLQEAGYSNLLLSYPIPVKVILVLYAAAPVEDQVSGIQLFQAVHCTQHTPKEVRHCLMFFSSALPSNY